MRDSLRDKKILVTGGAGFIGSHLVDDIIEKKPASVVVVDNFFLGKEENLKEAKKDFPDLRIYRQDASQFQAMEKIIRKERIDVVFNLATKALGYSFVDPDDAFMVNTNIASVLLRLLHQKFYKTLIHLSSSEAYGTAKFIPITESHPLDPQTLYAAGKAAADLMVNSYFHTYKLDVAIVRPFNNYGPRQNEGSYAAIIPLTIKRILLGEPPVLEGDGKQTRDFIYVKDTTSATIKIYENEKTRGKTINIASGRETSVKDIINSIINTLSYRGKIVRKPPRPADVRRHLADVTLARKLIGFEPNIEFEEGLKLTVDWYKNNLKGGKV